MPNNSVVVHSCSSFHTPRIRYASLDMRASTDLLCSFKSGSDGRIEANDSSLLRTLQCLGARLLEPTSKENKNGIDRSWQILTDLDGIVFPEKDESGIYMNLSESAVAGNVFHLILRVRSCAQLQFDTGCYRSGSWIPLFASWLHALFLCWEWVGMNYSISLLTLDANCFSLFLAFENFWTNCSVFCFPEDIPRLCTDLDGPMTSRLKAREPRRPSMQKFDQTVSCQVVPGPRRGGSFKNWMVLRNQRSRV